MSLFNDYSHQILHHQTEWELIRQNRSDRLAREARGVDTVLPWWRRLIHPEQRRSTRRRVANAGQQRYAH
jgi:hypothetical protein